jgi:hypothetical protein
MWDGIFNPRDKFCQNRFAPGIKGITFVSDIFKVMFPKIQRRGTDATSEIMIHNFLYTLLHRQNYLLTFMKK